MTFWTIVKEWGGWLVAMVVFFPKLTNGAKETGKIFQWLWKAASRNYSYRTMQTAKMDSLIQDVGEIKAQVRYNGGSSIKDAVKRIETKIDYNNKRLDIYDQCSDQMRFRVNHEGACTAINNAFLKLFNYQEADILGFSFESIIHEDEVLEVRNKWQRAITTKSKFYDEQRLFDRDGKIHHVIVEAVPLLEDNSLKEFHGTVELKPQNAN